MKYGYTLPTINATSNCTHVNSSCRIQCWQNLFYFCFSISNKSPSVLPQWLVAFIFGKVLFDLLNSHRSISLHSHYTVTGPYHCTFITQSLHTLNHMKPTICTNIEMNAPMTVIYNIVVVIVYLIWAAMVIVSGINWPIHTLFGNQCWKFIFWMSWRAVMERYADMTN